MSNIKSSLERLFKIHRLVFWYDAKEEMVEEFSTLNIADAEKIKVELAGFGLKYRLLQEEPQQKFLLYFPWEEPNALENWLLDLQLSNAKFSTDKASIYTQELGLTEDLKSVVSDHLPFFEAKSRRKQLANRVSEKMSAGQFKTKILSAALSARSESMEQILFAYIESWSKDQEKLDHELNRYHIHGHFWGRIKETFYYTSENPTLYGFLVDTFKKASALFGEEDRHLKATSLLKGWQDSQQYNDLYKKVSLRIEDDLELEALLIDKNIFDLEEDYFRILERKIVHDLSVLAKQNKPEITKALQKIRSRRRSFWYAELYDKYATLEYGYSLMELVQEYNSKGKRVSLDTIKKSYAEKYYLIDQYYRKFIFYYTKADENQLLSPIYKAVHGHYMNQFIQTINFNWTLTLKEELQKYGKLRNHQRNFFQYQVEPTLNKGQRVAVIISDAFRYEIGMELKEILRAERRFESEVEMVLSSLPSYTQLGMASLLPHKSIELADFGETVKADGQSTKGLRNRASILDQNTDVSATAINAKDLLKMETKTEGREFIKNYDLLYIYNNSIDKTGDDKVSEHEVFNAVEKELKKIIQIIKKLNNMNVYKFIVTADHGFHYEHEVVQDSDFLLDHIEGDKNMNVNRRFVVGKNLKETRTVTVLQSEQLQLDGGYQIGLPHGVNRFRVKGAGSKYVHGGWSIQEMAIPSVTITKKREEVVELVDIDIIKTSDKITSNIVPITFIQSKPVGEYLHPRQIKACLVAEDGAKLSNTFEYTFDFEDEADRARKEKFNFQFKAGITDNYGNQPVKLILKTPISADHWKVYKEYSYTLFSSITSIWDHD